MPRAPPDAAPAARSVLSVESEHRVRHQWLLFVAGAVLTWGAYVVTIDHGRSEFAGMRAGRASVPGPVAAMRAFMFIGLAYFLLGVVFPAAYLAMNKVDPGAYPNDPGWIRKGVVLSFVAGLLGAAGALCIVFAVGAAKRAGVSPGAVASLVFCFAPIVNVLVSMYWDPPATRPSPLFFVGIVVAAVGAGMVLYFKPVEAPHGAPAGGATPPHATVPAPAASQPQSQAHV